MKSLRGQLLSVRNPSSRIEIPSARMDHPPFKNELDVLYGAINRLGFWFAARESQYKVIYPRLLDAGSYDISNDHSLYVGWMQRTVNRGPTVVNIYQGNAPADSRLSEVLPNVTPADVHILRGKERGTAIVNPAQHFSGNGRSLDTAIDGQRPQHIATTGELVVAYNLLKDGVAPEAPSIPINHEDAAAALGRMGLTADALRPLQQM